MGEAAVVGADGHTHEAACLNCGTAIIGDYCHACGQRGHVHRTLGAFGHDLLHGVFHVEGKIWRTLPKLAWKPGELTRRYIDGHRARFVSPIALFLFSVFLMFAVVSASGGPVNVDGDSMTKEMAGNAARSEALVSRLEAERVALVEAGSPTTGVDRKIGEARAEASLLKTMSERGMVEGSAARISDDVPKWLGQPLGQAARNPELMLYKLQNNAYKYSWALIPISLPFMWLLFPFSRRFRLYDHMVFVTYSLAFMTLLLVVAMILGMVGLEVAAGLLMLVPPVHMYRQLKGAYDLDAWSALWRTVLLAVFATTAIGLFAALLFALGLF